MSETHEDPVEVISQTLATMRAEMEAFGAEAARIAGRTRRGLRMVIVTLALASFVVLMLVYQLTRGMAGMTEELAAMYDQFGSMTLEMGRITHHVSKIGHNVSRMPGMAEDMQAMTGGMQGMLGSVEHINQDTATIDQNMVTVRVRMQEMTQHFASVGLAVNRMRGDTNEMASPMSWLPFGGR